MSRTDDRQAALMSLMQSIFRQEERGHRVPCVNPRIAHWWTSEDHEMQEAAAAACSTCPALRDCRAYVEDFTEPGGVWAGQVPKRQGGGRRAGSQS